MLACTLAACNTFVRGVHFANKLELWYSLKAIASIRDFGMCVFIIVTGFFLYVLFEIFYFHESIHAPINQSKIIVAVWCFISAKYAFTLFWVGKEYLGFLSETRLILQDDD
ncbi:solute carrier family 48 (heme transporter), member 1 [Nesidiocoris tenuis]|nr:solute carrier family 48 (heme transporter), member 1 [Nesidiocoris tenuis]